MYTTYDAGVDIFAVRFALVPIVESEEIASGLVVDDDADGRIVGREVANASTHAVTPTLTETNQLDG